MYEGGGVVVSFDPNVCIHAADCIRGLPTVFDVKLKRWIRPENAPAERVAEQVRRCPSGALQFRMKPGD
jgi:uncharacterized Fe-S cluster protein YjdI